MAKILVVDDDHLLRETISSVLRKDGHEITEAKNGHEAQAGLEGDGFDLLILDILMPEADGIEVLTKLQQDGLDIPILAMSGGGQLMSGELAIQFARAFGADRVLYKPFSNHELRDAVADLLGGISR